MDIGLKRGVAIRGRVTDKATGRPARALVEYFVFADTPSRKEVPRLDYVRAYTSADGSFELVGLPGRGLITAKVPRSDWGRYLAGAGAEEIKGSRDQGDFITYPYIVNPLLFNALVEISPEPDAKALTCDVAIDPGKTVFGTVVGPDGNPVEGVDLKGSWGLRLDQGRLPTAAFTLMAINPKNPRPFFFYHSEKDLAAAVLVRGDEPKDFTVRLQPCAALVGRLLNDDGEPLAAVNVSGMIEDGQLGIAPGQGWYGFFWGQTDKDGRFRCAGLIPGIKLTAAVQKGARLTGTVFKDVTLKPGETKDLGDITVKPIE